jgi:predicted DsbA family dithiol-disulfide isomerase
VAKDRFFRAYFTEGEPIGDREVLARLAGEAGLDAEEVRALLAGNGYAEEVRADEAAAHSIGVTGVPFFVFDRRLAVSGAQPAESLVQVLQRAWASTPAESSFAAV